ncbi:MAG: cytochrome C oxidase subunit IV family protein [Acidobacteria bacterium]|nr:cytochrome C oxidase subunit IV family protein [Acidobacteriota bacterium]
MTMPEHIVSRKLYLVVCAILLTLTLVTWGAAQMDLGRWNILLALAIAFSKAGLVALFFMHVRDSPRLTQLALVAGVFWLGILLLLTMSDYLTR